MCVNYSTNNLIGGPTLKDAFEQAVLAMFNYMVDLSTVEIDNTAEDRVYEAEGSKSTSLTCIGHDYESLLFGLMNEFLYIFSTEFFLCKEVHIIDFDKENFKIKAKG